MVEKFICRNIIMRFGVPFSIISDNRSQYQNKFRAFCAQYKIRNYYSTPAYPPSDGQAKVSNKMSNKMILGAIKKRI